jgi:hypothetical protein
MEFISDEAAAHNDDVFVSTKVDHPRNPGCFVMVDPANVSISLADSIEIFQIQDKHVDMRIIVGYCMDLDTYHNYIGEPSFARLVQIMPPYMEPIKV